MKKFMYMCMMLLAATLTFTACGSDDDDNGNVNNGGGNNQQQSQNGEVVKDNYYSYTESIEVKNFGTMTCIGEATFDNGQATAMAISFVYPKKSQAQDQWNDYQNDPKMAEELPKYSYDGDRTITYTMDAESVKALGAMGRTYVCNFLKDTVKGFIDSIRQETQG